MTVVVAVAAAIVLLAGDGRRAARTLDLGTADVTSTTPRTPTPTEGDGELRSYTLDGSDPEEFPTDDAGLAFLALDDTFADATIELGPPQEQQPDINATTANTWHLAGGAMFTVVTAGTEPDDPIVGLVAEAPPNSGVRFAAHGDVVIGRSTPAEVARAWGGDHDRSVDEADDFVLRYVRCRHGWPVVVKFDQTSGNASWESSPVDRVLIAYADDDPVAACP